MCVSICVCMYFYVNICVYIIEMTNYVKRILRLKNELREQSLVKSKRYPS